MQGNRRLAPGILACTLIVVVSLLTVGLLAQEGGPADRLTAKLGGEKRARAHLSTDKPMYREGESVWGRAVVLDAFANGSWGDALVQFTVLSPKGEKVFNAWSEVKCGVGAFHWKVPAGQAGGEYTLKASFPREGFPPAERKFDIRAYRAPRFRTQIKFLRKGYGPGDEVAAVLTASRSEGGVPKGADVTIIARIDGSEVHRSEGKIDGRGECTARFPLPKQIEEGVGSLAFVIRDGGVQETAVKTLPILLNRVKVSFFPEGGDLVAGLPARVYVEARNTRRKPADVTGRILAPGGVTVCTFTTRHEGRGRFRFTPREGEIYTAVLDKPAGNVQRFLLPKVEPKGFSLRAGSKVYRENEAFWFFLGSTGDVEGRLVISRLEKEVASAPVHLSAGTEKAVALFASLPVRGVVRATLYDGEGKPRAERIIFVRPKKQVRVELAVSPPQNIPRGEVTVDVVTRDETGKAIQAVVGLAVTDDSILEKIEKREQAPRLPEQVLLESEVRELRDAHVYLANTETSERALDLLLGTQGWRRFAFTTLDRFIKEHGDAAKRVLAWTAPATRFGRGVRFKGMKEGLAGAPVDKPRAIPPPAPGRAPRRAGEERAQKDEPARDARRPAADRKAREWEDEEAEDAFPAEKKMKRRVGWGFLGGKIAVALRVYAHRPRPASSPEERNDFTETVYWHAGLKTDADGKARITFHLSDSITSFRVRADAFSQTGALGSSDALVVSRKPFYLEPKLPLELTAGDLVEVPVALFNGTGDPLQARLSARLGKGLILEGAEPTLILPGGRSERLYMTLVGGDHNGPVSVVLEGTAGSHADRVVRTIPVVPYGFPVEEALGGRLEGSAGGDLFIPDSVVPASITAKAAVYPSPLSTLTDALKGLLREPCGCFEQTSSTAYPNVMALRYMESHRVADTALVDRSRSLLEKGYKRLIGFECKRKGYEWFGGDPGHEALTAYGLMEFSDMAKVANVDGEMIARTRNWLLDRRDGKGGFKRNPRALDRFGGAPQNITNAYILWALLEAGEKGLEREIEAMRARAFQADDPYYLALASNVLLLAGMDGVKPLLEKVAKKQDADGAVRGAKTSITRSGGEGLVIETTALAILAWIHSGG
ncbi:MAG: alpha-2-macroglobulin family protein, partial [Planctomycetota bacterium]